jgi:ATP-dependent Clp protease ATP-binding subunit ClpC
MRELVENLKEKNLEIELDKSAQEFLAEKGFDPKFGARPLKRAIQKYVEDPLAEELLLQHFNDGDTIVVKSKKNKDELYFVPKELKKKNSKKKEEKENPQTETVD